MERVIPTDGEIATRLRLDPADARFLESALGRLPGGDELNSPVTLDLNGEGGRPGQCCRISPKQVTELVLTRSSYTGSPLCICTNRSLLERALRLGFTEIGFAGVESPFVCRDERGIFAIQPLSGGSPPEADAEVTRIESGAATGGEGRLQSAPRPRGGPRPKRSAEWPRAGAAGRDQRPRPGEAGRDHQSRRDRAAGHEPGRLDPGGRGAARGPGRREVPHRPADRRPAAAPQAVAAGQRDAEVAPPAPAGRDRRLIPRDRRSLSRRPRRPIVHQKEKPTCP